MFRLDFDTTCHFCFYFEKIILHCSLTLWHQSPFQCAVVVIVGDKIKRAGGRSTTVEVTVTVLYNSKGKTPTFCFKMC